MGQTCLAEPDADGDEARALRPLQAAAVTYRIAFGPRAGQVVLKLKTPWRDGTTLDNPWLAGGLFIRALPPLAA
jgi:hypothetical protein